MKESDDLPEMVSRAEMFKDAEDQRTSVELPVPFRPSSGPFFRFRCRSDRKLNPSQQRLDTYKSEHLCPDVSCS